MSNFNLYKRYLAWSAKQTDWKYVVGEMAFGSVMILIAAVVNVIVIFSIGTTIGIMVGLILGLISFFMVLVTLISLHGKYSTNARLNYWYGGGFSRG